MSSQILPITTSNFLYSLDCVKILIIFINHKMFFSMQLITSLWLLQKLKEIRNKAGAFDVSKFPVYTEKNKQHVLFMLMKTGMNNVLLSILFTAVSMQYCLELLYSFQA